MPEALSKVLMIAGGAALTCFVIGLLVYAGSQGGALASAVVGNTADVTDSLTDSKITQYKKNTVYGSEVLNAIRKFQSNLTVSVSTVDSAGNRTDVSYTGSEALDNVPYLADGSANAKYINPYAKFDSDVSVNANGVAAGLTFSQKKYVALADTGQLVGNGSGSGSGSGAGSGSGGSGGIDYSTLQDVVNSQSAQIADLVTALETSNTGNAATIQALKDQLSQMSTEQQELSDSIANLTASIEDLQDLRDIGVKLDALEMQVAGVKKFTKDGTFTFRAGQEYRITAIACGGAGGTGGVSTGYVAAKNDWPGDQRAYTKLYSASSSAGGNRGEYVIRKAVMFDTDVIGTITVGTNENDGNTVIDFSNGDSIVLAKGGGGGAGDGYGFSPSVNCGPYGCSVAIDAVVSNACGGGGGAGGFYTTKIDELQILNGGAGGSSTKGVGGASTYTNVSLEKASTGLGSYGGGAGIGYGAGGGGGGVACSWRYAAIGWWNNGTTGGAYTGYEYVSHTASSGGLGAPGIVIIEIE